MSVFIKGISAGELLRVFEYARIGANNCMIGRGVIATELPDHGDLIDRDKTVKAIEALISARLEWKSAAREQISGLDAAICAVMDAKKVIPAERSESDE